MTTTTESPLLRNLCNLTARALQGEWPREEDLHSQVMRLYRGVEYTPAEGVNLRLVDETQVGVAVSINVDRRVLPGEDAPTKAPSTPGPVSSFAECSLRARHATCKRTGRTCTSCGYPNQVVATVQTATTHSIDKE